MRVTRGVQFLGVSRASKPSSSRSEFHLLWAICFSSGVIVEKAIGRRPQSKAIARSEKRMVGHKPQPDVYSKSLNQYNRVQCVKMRELEKFIWLVEERGSTG